jgi:hypothetical protein
MERQGVLNEVVENEAVTRRHCAGEMRPVQLPMFHLLGTPKRENRYVPFESERADVAASQERLDWSDR